jgi:hypothetical protein
VCVCVFMCLCASACSSVRNTISSNIILLTLSFSEKQGKNAKNRHLRESEVHLQDQQSHPQQLLQVHTRGSIIFRLWRWRHMRHPCVALSGARSSPRRANQRASKRRRKREKKMTCDGNEDRLHDGCVADVWATERCTGGEGIEKRKKLTDRHSSVPRSEISHPLLLFSFYLNNVNEAFRVISSSPVGGRRLVTLFSSPCHSPPPSLSSSLPPFLHSH